MVMQKGRCSNCDSTNLMFTVEKLMGKRVIKEFRCGDCEHHGSEWYEVTYLHTLMEEPKNGKQ